MIEEVVLKHKPIEAVFFRKLHAVAGQAARISIAGLPFESAALLLLLLCRMSHPICVLELFPATNAANVFRDIMAGP